MLKNSPETYGVVARLLHWLIGFCIIGLLIAGLIMTDMESSPLKGTLYNLHKAFGMSVLGLMAARLVWRLVNVTPKALPTHKPHEVNLAKAIHWSFYVLLIAMPVSGWALSSAYGYAPTFFGLFTFPSLVPLNKEMGELYGEIHEIMGYVILAALALHVAGALKHYFIDKDRTLHRMIVGK